MREFHTFAVFDSNNEMLCTIIEVAPSRKQAEKRAIRYAKQQYPNQPVKIEHAKKIANAR